MSRNTMPMVTLLTLLTVSADCSVQEHGPHSSMPSWSIWTPPTANRWYVTWLIGVNTSESYTYCNYSIVAINTIHNYIHTYTHPAHHSRLNNWCIFWLIHLSLVCHNWLYLYTVNRSIPINNSSSTHMYQRTACTFTNGIFSICPVTTLQLLNINIQLTEVLSGQFFKLLSKYRWLVLNFTSFAMNTTGDWNG